MITIKDITGATIEVTDLKAAVRQCEDCKNSPFKLPSGHTVGEDHIFMLEQLKIGNREEWRAENTARYFFHERI